MKKIAAILLILCIALPLCACGEQSAQIPAPETSEAQDGRVLIVYYSYSGVTKGVSEKLQAKTGGDLLELVPAEPYPDDMYAASDRAAQELESGHLPELINEWPDLEHYDLVLIGGPVWSQKAAPPLAAYLSKTDFLGKTVAPFWTYNSNEGAYQEDVTGYIQNAEIRQGLGLSYASSMPEDEMDAALDQWLSAITTAHETEIEITMGNQVIEAVLNASPAAKEFLDMLPLTLSMTRMGEHEYYDALPQPLTHSEDLQTGYTVGDLAFWTPGDLFAIYFDEPQDAPEGLMILGRITSDLSVFSQLGNPEQVQIERKR